jgi:hypothetical protein
LKQLYTLFLGPNLQYKEMQHKKIPLPNDKGIFIQLYADLTLSHALTTELTPRKRHIEL